jgi:hypothetical protein
MKNELIQDLSKKAFMLAHEANDIHEQEEGEELSQTQFSNAFNQKLIELTVKECADVVKYYYIRGGEPITPQHIKKHFGVEE